MKRLYRIKLPKDTPNGLWGKAISPDGKYVFLLSSDRSEQEESVIFDVDTGEEVGHFTSDNTWGLALSPDGKTLAIGRKSQVLLYDVR